MTGLVVTVLLVVAVAGVLAAALHHQPQQETTMGTALRDNPMLWPHLPAANQPVPEDVLDGYAPPGSEFRAAWEYVLSHMLTPTEGSAFWHGVNIQRDATTAAVRARLEERLAALEEAHGSAIIDLADARDQLAALEVERDELRQALHLGTELDNHHNAAACPYCRDERAEARAERLHSRAVSALIATGQHTAETAHAALQDGAR